MVIAVNACTLQTKGRSSIQNFIYEVLLKMATMHPEHQFLVVFDNTNKESVAFPNNVLLIKSTSTPQNSLSFKYWCSIKLPAILKKYSPNIILQLTGYCCSTLKTPQILFLQDWTYNNFFSTKFLTKASKIVTYSHISKNLLVEKFEKVTDKLEVIYAAGDSKFKCLDFYKTSQVKDGFADGREYFIYLANDDIDDNIMTVLKAFSLFKKWQRSNMKLLVARQVTQQSIISKMETYKYKDDVVFLGDIDTDKLSKITASAYLALYLSSFDDAGISIINAMQCGVPVIAANVGCLPEIGDNAAFYYNQNSSDELSEKLQLIYKDEKLRSNLIKDGLLQAAKFNTDITAKSMWELIEKTAN
ncbi:MAG: glycosyltransferase [Chitinophagaceae bacterium]